MIPYLHGIVRYFFCFLLFGKITKNSVFVKVLGFSLEDIHQKL